MTSVEGPMADVRDMYMAHISLRREFGLAPALVRGVTAGDKARCETVSDHLGLLCTILHAHHGGEDALLWPKLLERGSTEVAPVVHRMESQHEVIDRTNEEVMAGLTAWRREASAHDREVLASALDRLDAALVEHMALEEKHILPLAEKYVTASEWQELGKHSMEDLPKKRLPLAFGMAMYEGDPQVIKNVLAEAPLVARLLMPIMAPRAYASHAKRVYGTTTPARSQG
ncbi:hemerythrin domain-containing protein [Sphaerisporangium rhizosphaerae]|uniref:Hemerythrin domain-containing protein n=1 Tax=Sphaerisporangium rhizosphaerae TaxID=2269375 RepID=A0ABW2P0G4_9ACTN